MNFPHLVASSRWDWRIGDATSERRVASTTGALVVVEDVLDGVIGDTARASCMMESGVPGAAARDRVRQPNAACTPRSTLRFLRRAA